MFGVHGLRTMSLVCPIVWILKTLGVKYWEPRCFTAHSTQHVRWSKVFVMRYAEKIGSTANCPIYLTMLIGLKRRLPKTAGKHKNTCELNRLGHLSHLETPSIKQPTASSNRICTWMNPYLPPALCSLCIIYYILYIYILYNYILTFSTNTKHTLTNANKSNKKHTPPKSKQFDK